MISEMKIEIIRYRAIIEEIKPNYLAPEFLNDFRALPDSFYRPDAPERYDFFIRRWGTHVVKVRGQSDVIIPSPDEELLFTFSKPSVPTTTKMAVF